MSDRCTRLINTWVHLEILPYPGDHVESQEYLTLLRTWGLLSVMN